LETTHDRRETEHHPEAILFQPFSPKRSQHAPPDQQNGLTRDDQTSPLRDEPKPMGCSDSPTSPPPGRLDRTCLSLPENQSQVIIKEELAQDLGSFRLPIFPLPGRRQNDLNRRGTSLKRTQHRGRQDGWGNFQNEPIAEGIDR